MRTTAWRATVMWAPGEISSSTNSGPASTMCPDDAGAEQDLVTHDHRALGLLQRLLPLALGPDEQQPEREEDEHEGEQLLQSIHALHLSRRGPGPARAVRSDLRRSAADGSAGRHGTGTGGRPVNGRV